MSLSEIYRNKGGSLNTQLDLKNLHSQGFTLIELVVVIAIIAIA
ncbi:MAG: prepilin-type N-terminal cleavage/methylation domain-containing protein, partial [Candidatus Dadabacteria bacterium]